MDPVIHPALTLSNYKDVLAARNRVRMKRELREHGFPASMIRKLTEDELYQLHKAYQRRGALT